MSLYRPLKKELTIDEYRSHFEKQYCKEALMTHQGILVHFYPENFDHAFYKNSDRKSRDKSVFSIERAERIDWIAEVLRDVDITIYAGWISAKKRNDFNSRVSLVTADGYVVVIRKINESKAKFVTAYVIDDESVVPKICSNPVIYQA